jgi:hypothetical protein
MNSTEEDVGNGGPTYEESKHQTTRRVDERINKSDVDLDCKRNS